MSVDGTHEGADAVAAAAGRAMPERPRSTAAYGGLRADVAGLTPGEYFVVWVFRTLLEGPASRPAIDNAFRLHCGAFNAESAAACFARLFETLAAHSRRTLGFHRAECMAVSASERTLLALIAAAQAGDMDHASAVAEWLVPRRAVAGLAVHASTLAYVLEASGLRLPLRVARPVPIAECG